MCYCWRSPKRWGVELSERLSKAVLLKMLDDATGCIRDEAKRVSDLEILVSEMLAVVHAIQWAGGSMAVRTDTEEPDVAPCCPSCGVPSAEVEKEEDDPFTHGEHASTCELAAVVRRAGKLM